MLSTCKFRSRKAGNDDSEQHGPREKQQQEKKAKPGCRPAIPEGFLLQLHDITIPQKALF